VVYSGRVTSFNAESLQKAWVTHEFGFKNLYRYIAEDDLVVRSPNLTHATNGNAIN
jgi:hypothetical protein